MDVKAAIDLTDAQVKELSQILACTEAELANKLAPYASAALTEYAMMFLGQKVFRRGSDQQEYRLLLLIEQAFGRRVPNEEEVCRLFQTTATESRALIRRVISKYQYQLGTAIQSSMKQILQKATQEKKGEPFTVAINSVNVVDELNQLLAEIDGNLKPVSKKRGSVSIYEISPSSHEKLKKRLEV